MFGNRLKEIISSKNMNFSTLKKLLSDVGIEISNSQLSFYASGKRKPKDKKIWLKIAEVLDVKLEYLITDTDYYLQIIEEKTDKSSDKNKTTDKNILYEELFNLIDKNSASEVEKVNRYCSLASTFKKLGDDILEEGAVLYVPSGDSMIKKTNPAIAEQVRVNAALIKLDEFFEEKRSNKPKNDTGKDWSKFTK